VTNHPGARAIIDAIVTSDDWQSDQAFYNREAYDDPDFQCTDDDEISDADIGQLHSTQTWLKEQS
jgi:hypothetical protein